MFLVENDLIDNIFEEPRINLHSETREKLSNELIFRPNPFKELVFKYRKIPKLEMRYNLREKVKNTRSEKIKRNKVDVSKTRWPMNKYHLQGKQLLNSIRNLKKDDGFQRTIFISMFPELESASNKVNKNNKFLSKRDDRSVNIDSLRVNDTDAAKFSIENLIDNLIINSLNDNNNNSKSNESLVTKQNLENNNDNETNHDDANTMSIILINTTNKNIDTDNYTYDLNLTKVNKTYLEEIIIMSERIEENNNLSVEFVKRVTGLSNLENETSILNTKNCSVDRIETTPDHNVDLKQIFNPRAINATIISNKTTVEVASSTERRTVPVLTKNFKQKSKQRMIRKLNRKLN
ncbi:unnamed protein product [Euphydryas editha]|nr:unnamed protein product [Euphydryas editha]